MLCIMLIFDSPFCVFATDEIYIDAFITENKFFWFLITKELSLLVSLSTFYFIPITDILAHSREKQIHFSLNMIWPNLHECNKFIFCHLLHEVKCGPSRRHRPMKSVFNIFYRHWHTHVCTHFCSCSKSVSL